MTANIKCPKCSHIQEIDIPPQDRCLPFYKCYGCQNIIFSPKDVCCVICAYSDKKCTMAKD